MEAALPLDRLAYEKYLLRSQHPPIGRGPWHHATTVQPRGRATHRWRFSVRGPKSAERTHGAPKAGRGGEQRHVGQHFRSWIGSIPTIT
jgi:hypothetical protein